jgi:hypothetical protein
MPVEKRGHVLIADELTPARLLAAFSYGCARLIVDLYRGALFFP